MLAESSAFYASYGALWVLVVGLALLVLLVYRHFGMAALGTLEGVQRDGLAVGEEARELTGVDAAGRPFVWAPAGVATFLLFAASECQPCAAVLPFVNRLAQAGDLDVDVLAVVAGASVSASRMQEKYGLSFPVLAEDGSQGFEGYRVRVTPFGFVVGEDGRVRAKGLCSDASRLKDLLAAGGMEAAAQATARELAATHTDLALIEGGHS